MAALLPLAHCKKGSRFPDENLSPVGQRAGSLKESTYKTQLRSGGIRAIDIHMHCL